MQRIFVICFSITLVMTSVAESLSYAASPAPSIPTIQDEEATYTLWGWNWSNAIHPVTRTEPYGGNYIVSSPDIHGDTEADDLWTYGEMVDRGGNAVYENRRKAWEQYFINGTYRSQLVSGGDAGYGYDHMYGIGLVQEYLMNGNANALAEAENLGAIVEDGWSGDGWSGDFNCLDDDACYGYGYRRPARHLLLAAYLAKATNATRWNTLRNTIVNTFLNMPGWSSTYGTYFAGQYETDLKFGGGSYAAGYRYYWPPAIGILAEGLYQVYLQTNNATIKSRLISMANFISAKGLDPTTQYAGYAAGIDPSGNPYHKSTGPVYTTALVDVLVIGYKLSGNAALLNQAKYFFNRGTKGDPSTGSRLCADNEVHHFVDTVFASSTSYFYLDFNRAELFYTYLIFENGGLPTVISSAPPPPPTQAPPSPPTGLNIH